MQPWTMGVPFYLYLDTSNKGIYPDNAEYTSIWPEGFELDDSERQEIIDQFYGRTTSQTPPQYWLRRWQNVLKREGHKWRKLIDSETALRDDDAIYNYDLTEESHYNSTSSSEGTGTSEGQTSSTGTSWASETPDGSVSDIQTYMSSAAKNDGSSTSEGTSASESSATSQGNTNLRRYGNIGVMTAATIIGGYRKAMSYCAMDQIYSELEPLFLQVWEVDDNGYLYATD